MGPDGGFIKLWRKIFDSPGMDDPWIFYLFVWCIRSARYKDCADGLERGQFQTQRSAAADALKVSPSKWYRGMERLHKLGCVKIETSNNRTTITVCNYETYQGFNNEPEQQMNNGWTTDEQPSLLEEGKEGKEVAAAAKKTDNRATPEFDPLAVPFPAALDTPAFRNVWAQWMSQRKTRRFSTRAEWCSRQLKTLASFGESVALAAINETLLNDYQGIFPHKHVPHSRKAAANMFDSLEKFAKAGDDDAH